MVIALSRLRASKYIFCAFFFPSQINAPQNYYFELNKINSSVRGQLKFGLFWELADDKQIINNSLLLKMLISDSNWGHFTQQILKNTFWLRHQILEMIIELIL